MLNATSFPSSQISSEHAVSRQAPRWTMRDERSILNADRRAAENLAAMRLLIPLAMIMILFILWYAGMPLLPS